MGKAVSKKTPTIFVSHITEEAELASIIKKQIKADFADSVKVFVSSDMEGVEVGNSWLAHVSDALDAAAIELLLCSTLSVTRPWVNFEAGAAWQKKIAVIPVCHSGFYANELPMPFRVLNAIEANQKNGLERIYHRIASSVGVEVPKVDFDPLIKEIKAFERHYSISLPKPPLDMIQGNRLVGDWIGTGFDLEVPKYVEYETKLSYVFNLELKRRSSTIAGSFTFYSKELDRSDTCAIELIHVAADYFYFKYWLAAAHANHCGMMLMHLSAVGDQLTGMFLTNKVWEKRMGIGRMEFRRHDGDAPVS
jgi:hypothetical protein